jgi:hypothetical protein
MECGLAWLEKDMEGRGHGMFEINIPDLCGGLRKILRSISQQAYRRTQGRDSSFTEFSKYEAI